MKKFILGFLAGGILVPVFALIKTLKFWEKHVDNDYAMTAGFVKDVIHRGVEKTLYGDSVSPRRRPTYGRNYQDYTRPRPVQPVPPMRCNNPQDAQIVVDRVFEIVRKYGRATVADFKELVGVMPLYKDNHIGWTEEEINEVRALGDEIHTPRPVRLS